jgi:hypothetical protein
MLARVTVALDERIGRALAELRLCCIDKQPESVSNAPGRSTTCSSVTTAWAL